MSLETYTGFIKDMVITNPEPTDPVSQGDDHVRGVKMTLANQFSGFTTATEVAVTAEVLNSVPTLAPLESPQFTGIPLAPTAAPGTATTQIATTEFAAALVAGQSLVGRKWQSVTALRGPNIDYTNDTGGPIDVSVSGRSTSTSCTMQLLVDGVGISEVYYSLSAGSASIGGAISAEVLPGEVYRISVSSFDISIWAERRPLP